ncbi:hypothetical protein AB0P16_14990 [Dietzia maris]|uniref:hypothetical protein n=1 Tax=Dietzia maris TaxID=37915 RepID=UPI00341CC104
MGKTTRVAAIAVAVAAALSNTACSSGDDGPDGGGQGERPTSSVVAIDVSGSAAQADLEEIGITAVADRLKALGKDSSVKVLAFDSAIGTSSCRTLEYRLEWQNNSTQFEDDRKQLLKNAPAALDEYLTCVKEEAAGKDHLTDIFGSAVASAALLDRSADTKTLDYISDGCHTLDPQIVTCSPAVEDAAWRNDVLSSLPQTRKADLDGVDVTVRGLGVGAPVEQSTIAGLRDFMSEYFSASGAEVSIQ